MKSFEAGPLTIYTYGLIVAAAAALALAWMANQKHTPLKKGTVSLLAVLALPLCVLCARLGLCLVQGGFYLFRENFFFNFARGGYLLYGAFGGFLLAAWLTAKGTKQRLASVLDAAAAPGALVIAVGRLAEGLVGVGYGRGIVEWFDPWNEWTMFPWEDPEIICRFPFGIPDYYGDYHWSIFLMEAIAALVVLVLVVRLKDVKPGARVTLLLLVYAGCQTLFESMREDAIPRWGFVRVSQLFSGITVAAVLLAACIAAGERVTRKQQIVSWIGVLACIGLILVMEFALEQKISFLRFMRKDVCYVVMALGSLGLMLFPRPVWQRAFTDKA